MNVFQNKLKQIYDDNITTLIGKQSSSNIAQYIIIFVICLFISRWANLTLSSFVFMIIAVLLIYYFWSKKNIYSIPISDDLNIKSNLIFPRSTRLNNSYPDLINFLYNIRSYYFSNQTEFSTLVLNIDNFVQLYEEIMYKDMTYCAENIEVAVNFYLEAQQNLHAVIYGLNPDADVTRRFHLARHEFDAIMTRYVDQIIHKCNKEFKPGSLDNNSMFYDPDETKPVNFFDMGIVPWGNRH